MMYSDKLYVQHMYFLLNTLVPGKNIGLLEITALGL